MPSVHLTTINVSFRSFRATTLRRQNAYSWTLFTSATLLKRIKPVWMHSKFASEQTDMSFEVIIFSVQLHIEQESLSSMLHKQPFWYLQIKTNNNIFDSD